jgi:hypothetical protein
MATSGASLSTPKLPQRAGSLEDQSGLFRKLNWVTGTGRARLEYHKHVQAIHPTIRDQLGVERKSLLMVTTDLALPSSPDHDEEEFIKMHRWVEDYRDRRYPGFEIEYRNG